MCRSSLDKILSEDRCYSCCSFSATSNMVLQNRNLFPASLLFSGMKIPFSYLMWKVLNAFFGMTDVNCFIAFSIKFFTSIFNFHCYIKLYFWSYKCSKTCFALPLLTKLQNPVPINKNFLCAYFRRILFSSGVIFEFCPLLVTFVLVSDWVFSEEHLRLILFIL